MRAQESQRLRAQEAESQVESLEGEQRWRRSTTSCRLLRCCAAHSSGATRCRLLRVVLHCAAASHSCWLT